MLSKDLFRLKLGLKGKYENKYGDSDYDEDKDKDTKSHNQGLSCASCHSTTTASAKSGGVVFTSGATIFTALDAADKSVTKAAENYKLRLILQDGSTQDYKLAKGTGNVNGTFNAGITHYTAKVLNTKGEAVNTSLENSHDASQFDCNRCHTAKGLNIAPGRIVSFKYTPPSEPGDANTTDPDDTNNTVAKSFKDDVLPVLNKKCEHCHGGKGDFTLSKSDPTPYESVKDFIDKPKAEDTRLLRKASGYHHNRIIKTSSQEYITVRDWIREGSLNN